MDAVLVQLMSKGHHAKHIARAAWELYISNERCLMLDARLFEVDDGSLKAVFRWWVYEAKTTRVHAAACQCLNLCDGKGETNMKSKCT